MRTIVGRAWHRTWALARDTSPATVPERSATLVERCREAFGLGTVEILTSGNRRSGHPRRAPARDPPASRLPRCLAGVASLAAGLSLEASAAGGTTTAATGGLSPFVGIWKAEYPLNPGDKPLLWVEMQIRDAGGRPTVDLTFFRNRRQEDGSVQTDRVKTEVTDPRVTGNVLRFRTRGEFQYKTGHPKETVELDQVFEIAGSGEATLRQTWSSLEGRKDAPPPPPAPIVLRRAG